MGRNAVSAVDDARRLCIYTRRQIEQIQQLRGFTQSQITAMKAVSAVLPFRVNNYVIEELIDWSNIPEDPIYQLTSSRFRSRRC